MNFHVPCRIASPPECSTRVVRPGARIAEERGQNILAVGRCLRFKPLARERGEGGEEIHLADQRVGHAGLHAPRPADDERHARATLEDAVLAAAQRAGRPVAAKLLHRVVLVAVVHHRAVVAGEDDQRAFGESVLFQNGRASRRRTSRTRQSRRRAGPSRSCRRTAGAARAARGCRGWRSRGRTAGPCSAR